MNRNLTRPVGDGRELQDDSRRNFLGTCLSSIAGLTIIGFVAPLLGGCSDGSITSVDQSYQATFDVSTLAADNQALVTTAMGGDGFPIIIIRQSAGAYIALSTQCTHEACQVSAPSQSEIVCTCHNSRFDLTGQVLQGPARTALYRYATTFDSASRKLTVRAA
jgi:Rieske Fe-S protein